MYDNDTIIILIILIMMIIIVIIMMVIIKKNNNKKGVSIVIVLTTIIVWSQLWIITILRNTNNNTNNNNNNKNTQIVRIKKHIGQLVPPVTLWYSNTSTKWAMGRSNMVYPRITRQGPGNTHWKINGWDLWRFLKMWFRPPPKKCDDFGIPTFVLLF